MGHNLERRRSIYRMASRIVFVVAICVIVGLAFTSATQHAKCDCECLFKKCEDPQKKHPWPGAMSCSELRKVCEECETGVCNDETKECIDNASSQEDIMKCIKGWGKCKDCMCANKQCKKHVEATGEKSHCAEALSICRKCDTNECNKERKTCIKKIQSHEDLHKCVDAWFKCAKCFCVFQSCKVKSPEPETCPTV